MNAKTCKSMHRRDTSTIHCIFCTLYYTDHIYVLRIGKWTELSNSNLKYDENSKKVVVVKKQKGDNESTNLRSITGDLEDLVNFSDSLNLLDSEFSKFAWCTGRKY